MRVLSAALCGILVLGYATVAKADSTEIFDVSATTLGGSSITGTLTFDTTTLAFTDSDLTTTLGPITGASTNSGLNPSSVFEGFGPYGAGIYVVFNIPGQTLAGYAGGAVCSTTYPDCGPASSYLFDNVAADQFTSGSLTLESNVTPTPEPSSLLLLGTGLAGIVTALRRRRA